MMSAFCVVWLGRWTCDQQVVGATPRAVALSCNDAGQVVHT